VTAEQDFIDVWMSRLATEATGLNFKYEDDRSTFRFRITAATSNLRWSGMSQLAQYLGAVKIPRSRDGAIRAITDRYMQQHGWQREGGPREDFRPRARSKPQGVKLTPEMLRTLLVAEHGGAVVAGKGSHAGRVEWIYFPTVLALIKHGLLEHIYGGDGELGGRLTAAGRAVIAARKKTPAQLEADIAEVLTKDLS
jgi:hypothetical protein